METVLAERFDKLHHFVIQTPVDPLVRCDGGRAVRLPVGAVARDARVVGCTEVRSYTLHSVA